VEHSLFVLLSHFFSFLHSSPQLSCLLSIQSPQSIRPCRLLHSSIHHLRNSQPQPPSLSLSLLSPLFSIKKNKKSNRAKTTDIVPPLTTTKEKSLPTAFLSRASPFSLLSSSSFHPLAHGSRDCRMAAACSADNWGKHASNDLTGHAFYLTCLLAKLPFKGPRRTFGPFTFLAWLEFLAHSLTHFIPSPALST
jgi:hypothetical protein